MNKRTEKKKRKQAVAIMQSHAYCTGDDAFNVRGKSMTSWNTWCSWQSRIPVAGHREEGVGIFVTRRLPTNREMRHMDLKRIRARESRGL